MGIAKARRIASRLHRDELDESGHPFVDHLARVAAAVEASGGGPTLVQAAWLSGAGSAPGGLAGLNAQGVAPAVMRVVDALTARDSDRIHPDAELKRVAMTRGGLVVLRAIAADRCRPESLAGLADHVVRTRDAHFATIRRFLGEAVATETLVRNYLPPDARPQVHAALCIPVGDRDAVAAIIDLVAEAQPAHRHYLREALIHAVRAVPVTSAWIAELEAMTNHPVAIVRHRAVLRLVAIDPAAAERFVVAAITDDPHVIASIVQKLPDRLVPEVRPALYALLHGKRAVGTPAAAFDHLARHPDDAFLPAVAHAVFDDGGQLSDRAGRVLREWPDPALVPVLLDRLATAGSTGPIIEVLVAWHVPELVDVLTARIEASRRAHPQWAEALGRIGTPDCVPGLLAMARSGDTFTAAAAVRGLRTITGVELTDIALEFCDHPEPDVRAEGVRLLATRGHGKAAARRLEVLCDGPHQRIAVRGLARLADPETSATLARVVIDASDRRTRHLAGRTLRTIGRFPYFDLSNPRARRVAAWLRSNPAGVTVFLTDADELVRARAAARLGEVGTAEDSADPLRAALRDPSPRVRANAATALGLLRPVNLADILRPALTDAHRDVRDAAAAALRSRTAVPRRPS